MVESHLVQFAIILIRGKGSGHHWVLWKSLDRGQELGAAVSVQVFWNVPRISPACYQGVPNVLPECSQHVSKVVP